MRPEFIWRGRSELCGVPSRDNPESKSALLSFEAVRGSALACAFRSKVVIQRRGHCPKDAKPAKTKSRHGGRCYKRRFYGIRQFCSADLRAGKTPANYCNNLYISLLSDSSMMDSVRIRSRGRLPHWEQSGSTYFVTFRLADSLPREALQRATTATHSKQIGHLLDAGRGECILRIPKVAGIMRDALKRFDGDRYDLCAWCIMPNHVHVIFRPKGEQKIEGILHSWKSYSANRIQREASFQGAIWQREYFDHLVRFPGELERLVRYVAENPERAGLKDWPWVEVFPGRF